MDPVGEAAQHEQKIAGWLEQSGDPAHALEQALRCCQGLITAAVLDLSTQRLWMAHTGIQAMTVGRVQGSAGWLVASSPQAFPNALTTAARTCTEWRMEVLMPLAAWSVTVLTARGELIAPHSLPLSDSGIGPPLCSITRHSTGKDE